MSIGYLNEKEGWFPSLRWVEEMRKQPSTSKDTAAVIVTYNPDITRLEQNLEAVFKQVDCVLLFDNGSKNINKIKSLSKKYPILIYFNKKNCGLSKALNRSCKKAQELGVRYALLLDQDSVSSLRMVSILKSHVTSEVGLVSPEIIDRNTQEVKSNRTDVVPIKRAITSGSLVVLEAWEKVGGFDESLFVDWVDYDFSANLRFHGYKILKDYNTWLLHEMGHREFAFQIWLPRHRRKIFYRTNHSESRQVDKARSWQLIRKKYGLTKIGIQECLYIEAVKIKDLIVERNRFKLLSSFYKGKKIANEYMKNKNNLRNL